MKNIISIQIWQNGQAKSASLLNARIINDDLNESCTFYYELREADVIIPSIEEGGNPTVTYGSKLADGNLSMTGSDYINWDGSNDTAYTFITNQLNLTLITE